MWTVDYEADIASDLSAIHRIDDPMTLDGPRYFSLALRLAAYAGVIQAIAVEIERREKDGGHAQHGASSPVPNAGGVTRVSDSAALASLADDIEWKRESA